MTADPRTWLVRGAIVVHRWLGVVLCVVFLIWFLSGIGMMYLRFPEVTAEDRLERSPALDPSAVRLSPEDAYATLGLERPPALPILTTFDGRPVYRFPGGRQGFIVYADTGERQQQLTDTLRLRLASAWARQPARLAVKEVVEERDQWTLQGELNDGPVTKYSWPTGEQVYLSDDSGDVVQYTTTMSRLGAYLGPIPHWFYYRPLRTQGATWSRAVIWSSGLGTLTATIGVLIGLWMYSPSRRYRHAGTSTRIPYHGAKRWHMILGLAAGLATVTWVFSGMLSMDPFPSYRTETEASHPGHDIPDALAGSVELSAFASRPPREALAMVAPLGVKELQLTSFDGNPIYLAMLDHGDSRVVPVAGTPARELDRRRIIEVITRTAGPGGLSDVRELTQYDRYYLDRERRRPLPVIRAELNDAQRTRYYIDPKTARLVHSYSSSDWAQRWLYHGLHSLNFPWLYNHRPLWDIVVATLMLGGAALCATSLVLAWRVLGRTLSRSLAPEESPMDEPVR